MKVYFPYHKMEMAKVFFFNENAMETFGRGRGNGTMTMYSGRKSSPTYSDSTVTSKGHFLSSFISLLKRLFAKFFYGQLYRSVL